ncbi:tRNA glutamyl-Q synthetase [Flavilitoribacter nigricans DSM 23189 = NBRC 102662]|uniref:tRNA glutamyl-Q synthetase n=1 Tax=Flavilitoribacter nigricans (strain ATCC 23147 / DSM 23189 / NBRC 102662 / NCIMB 1420 / SS-2) TaxID=1122177 RepID=A0A2D0NI98_FLAN2|nr:tRNA glutamyl-Q synthetase [Flavilitoribacter nigricans DSM 23189 = NBRC 102662]
MLRTRLAPTPSGYLHLGNALSFVVTWAIARAREGQILLRIDDLDAGRRRPEYLEDIFRTIEWLDIDFDEGPEGPDDFLAQYSQQLRLPQYHEALRQLKEQGHLYACTCSRKEIRQLSTNGNYPGTCLKQGKDFDAPRTAWRVKVGPTREVTIPGWKRGIESIDLGREMGDFVVRQKNRAPAYQIASLVDDEHWKINFIVRGLDLLPSTGAQLYLADLLGYEQFTQATFWHHDLITGEDGQKLSKSAGADALKTWREAGKTPGDIFQIAADWLGVTEGSIRTSAELLAAVKDQNL